MTDFIRYYVKYMPYRQWENLWEQVPVLQQWELTQGWRFNYEQSYGYSPGTHIHEVSYVKRKCEAVIEHHLPSDVSGTSQIWKGGQDLPATVLDDLLALLSIATNSYIHALLREYLRDGTRKLRTYPTVPELRTRVTVKEDELGEFLVQALKKSHTEGWAKSSGFIPAVHWYYQALISHGSGPGILELALFWVTLEVLANAEGYSGHKKDMVSKMLVNHGFSGNDWTFLQTALTDWYDARNFTFHEGQQPSWTTAKLDGRLRQVRAFTSLVLADLLVPQRSEWKSQLASRISDILLA